nr:hypothetical protein BaRGS_019306 [Batillaria attramentaria]
MCIFGRPIRDFIPVHPGKYQPHTTWQETLSSREEALRNRHMRAAERLSEHTRILPPLVVGDCVRIQNQTGPNTTKWDKTGLVVEVRQFDQYVVRVDAYPACSAHHHPTYSCQLFSATGPQSTDASS